MKILLLKDYSEKYEILLKQSCFDLTFIPVLQKKLLPVETTQWSTYEALIITSKEVINYLEQSRDMPRHQTIFCVGKETKEKIQADFPDCEVLGGSNNAADLASFIISHYQTEKPSKPLLFLHGEKYLKTLPTMLAEHDFQLETLTVYQTDFHTEASLLITEYFLELKQSDRVCICFFSPSGIDFTFDLISEYLNYIKAIVCFGNSTRAAADMKLNQKNDVIILTCEEPTPESLLKAIETIK